jgi:hypothetical protein
MRKMFQVIVAATIAGLPSLAAVTAASAATHPHAGPAVSCYADTCHGHDPVIYNCSVSSTASSSDANVTVWRRWSGNCDASWARAQLSAAAISNGYTMEVAASTTNRYGQDEFMCYPGPSNTGALNEYCTGTYGGSLPAYTDMVDSKNLVTAIAYIYNRLGRFIDQVVVNS